MDFTLLRDYCGTPVEGHFLSEKFDGWRVGVSGGRLITRGGNFLNAPSWFMDGLPDGIDAELFAGRGNFNLIQGMIRDGWHGLTLQVFDAVIPGPFRSRLAYLKTLELPGHCRIVNQIRCRDTEHLIRFADEVVSGGGEGAVVRNPASRYVQGRTDDVLRWVPQDPARNRRRVA
jgi:DNA ligase-1